MSSHSQTISKLQYLLIATFPFLAPDCSSFPLHFQLTCNCTAGIPIIHHKRTGTKNGKWGGSFLRHLCCWWDGIFLPAPQLLSVSSKHLFLTAFKTSNFSCIYPADFQLCSSCVGCRQPFLMGSFFQNWLLVMPARQSASYVYISMIKAKLAYIAFPTLTKIYYFSESYFMYFCLCVRFCQCKCIY